MRAIQYVSVSGLGRSPHGLNRVLKKQLAVKLLPLDFDFLPIDYWILLYILNGKTFRLNVFCVEFNPTNSSSNS
jgi:hypothetical protein